MFKTKIGIKRYDIDLFSKIYLNSGASFQKYFWKKVIIFRLKVAKYIVFAYGYVHNNM